MVVPPCRPSPLELKILPHLLSFPLESLVGVSSGSDKGCLEAGVWGPPIVHVSTLQMNFQAISSPIAIPNLPTSPPPI